MLLAFLAFTRAFVKAAPGRGGWLVTQPRIRPRRLFRPEATMATRERERETGNETLRERKFITGPEKSPASPFSSSSSLSLCLSFFLRARL